MVIIESPCSSIEESEWNSVSYEVKPNYMQNWDNLIEHSFLDGLKTKFSVKSPCSTQVKSNPVGSLAKLKISQYIV